MDGNLRTCWRCGVDFDPAGFVGDAPCPDCQEDDVGTDWLIVKHKGGRLTNEEREERIKRIKELYQEGLLDKEIGDRMGLSRSTISKWRDKLELPEQSRPGKHMWNDIDAHMKHAGTMVKKRKRVGRGKRVGNFAGSGKEWRQ